MSTTNSGVFTRREQTAANRGRRTPSVLREPVTPVEHAMDIAIGAEGKPWEEEKETA